MCINERQLICFELIFVFNNKEVVSVSFEKVDSGADLLVEVHVLDLYHKHESIDIDSLLAQDVRFSVVGRGSLLVDKKYLLSFFLALLMIAIEQQGPATDDFSVID